MGLLYLMKFRMSKTFRGLVVLPLKYKRALLMTSRLSPRVIAV